MFQFFRHIRSLIEFTQLPREQKPLVFYSEGKNYWVHLEGLVKQVLANADIPVCYISSSTDDPGLELEHPNYHTFKIDEGFVRDWLFENMDAGVLVMSMPDLNQYQVKRSKYDVHYVYVQHSLVSFHMVYREGAFDYFDTIFCAGPHHLKEIRALEAKYQLPKKNLIEHGYDRLDAIIEESHKHAPRKATFSENSPPHVLMAPSWGPDGAIESGIGKKLVDNLLSKGFKVTFRPHPQTTKFASEQVNSIVSAHAKNPLFSFEDNVAGQESLQQSDVMISDWSGAALDYAFGLNKPVLFIDVPRKVNNPNYQDIEIEPLEVGIREIIGEILEVNDLEDSGQILINLCNNRPSISIDDYVFNVGSSRSVGSSALLELCNEK